MSLFYNSNAIKRRIIRLFILCFLLWAPIYGWTITTDYPKHEVRAVWLTTIGGLDWPRQKAHNGESIQRQKEELCRILDKLEACHFNTVLLQTRIRGTVIYPSVIEPWDYCLTGTYDKSPGYDPLAFAIEECHKRNMQLHAWVVAFPGHVFATTKKLGRKSMPQRIPKLCMKTNQGWMLDPGVPGTDSYLASICSEIVDNYDVDGIHLDYVRYPETELRYSDALTFKKYGKGQRLSQWRRDNVTRCVKAIHDSVKSKKPWVWLSCSPIGKYSDLSRFSSKGWNAYDAVNQDAQGWVNTNLMDMLCPMMYFKAGNNYYPFALDWKESANGKPIANGLGAYKLLASEGNWNMLTLEQELRFSRQIESGGQAFFRCQMLMENTKGLYDFLKNDFYRFPALTHPMSWAGIPSPQAPANIRIEEQEDGFNLKWDSHSEVKEYIIYASSQYPIDTTNPLNMIALHVKSNHYTIKLPISRFLLPFLAVTAIDKYGQESPVSEFNTPLDFQPSKPILMPFDPKTIVLEEEATEKSSKKNKKEKRKERKRKH